MTPIDNPVGARPAGECDSDKRFPVRAQGALQQAFVGARPAGECDSDKRFPVRAQGALQQAFVGARITGDQRLRRISSRRCS